MPEVIWVEALVFERETLKNKALRVIFVAIGTICDSCKMI